VHALSLSLDHFFIFSPEVGRQIDGERTDRSVTVDEIDAIRGFWRGKLIIENFQLKPGTDGCPKIEWMDFSVQLEGGY